LLSYLWRVTYRSGVLIPLVFIILTALFAPISYSGEFDVDEGVNLMKPFSSAEVMRSTATSGATKLP
jgi:hypothetical protein